MRIFLSKPQAWHIIAAQRAVNIISPFGAVSHHAPACICLRLDDIQCWYAIPSELMIYTPSAWFGAKALEISTDLWYNEAKKGETPSSTQQRKTNESLFEIFRGYFYNRLCGLELDRNSRNSRPFPYNRFVKFFPVAILCRNDWRIFHNCYRHTNHLPFHIQAFWEEVWICTYEIVWKNI